MPAKGEVLSTTQEEEWDIAVVGGGIVGLAIAYRAGRRGLRAVVLERDRAGAGASGQAAGMLAPVSEAEVGHAELLEDGLEAARAWPGFARVLGGELHAAGTLIVARDRDEAEALDRERAHRERLGLRVERLLPSAARRLEPALAPSVRLALHVPDDRAVDPRAVVAALRERVEVREGTEVVALRDGDAAGHDDDRDGDAGAPAVVLANGEVLRAGTVVLAAGAWSADLLDVPVRPVKGQILRLRDPAGPGLVERTIRFPGGYLVPRGDGRYALGATVEERGFDTTVTAGGLYELLRDAGEVVPGISELVVEEAAAALRPGTPGNVPIVERRGRTIVATGHFRNGVLLAPVTADRVVGALALA
ncbi:MAG TPA: glycine oxidase ThiO [Solirubrobacteraceae bacterium]|nr:glycine oxidase ThiO [Solirubrobacteraceae bacterium]